MPTRVLRRTEAAHLPDTIQDVAPEDERAERLVRVIDTVIDKLETFVHKATVDYTEGFRNLTARPETLRTDIHSAVVHGMAKEPQAFHAWQSWVPELATMRCVHAVDFYN